MTSILDTIARLKELEGKATPEPWGWQQDFDDDNNPLDHSFIRSWSKLWSPAVYPVKNIRTEADAEMITESRNALPEIIECLEDALGIIDLWVPETNTEKRIFKKTWGIE